MGRTHATIVCIDDSEEMGLIVEKFLVGAGYYVLKASSGREGVNLVIREKPSLVLMDIMMPDMDGFEACSLLQQDPSTSHIPVVFITASESEEDRVRAFAVGGVDFLIKPVKKTDLLSKVETLLAGQNRWAEITSTTLSPVRSGLSRFREFRQHLATRLTLSPEQADEAQGLAPGGIYSGLASLGVAEDQTARLMAQFLRLPFLTSLDTAELRLGVLPTSFCRQNMVVPVHLVDSGNASPPRAEAPSSPSPIRETCAFFSQPALESTRLLPCPRRMSTVPLLWMSCSGNSTKRGSTLLRISTTESESS
jgi:CheY-like chemotaxis protein